MISLKMDAFDQFHHGWALLTAGDEAAFNTMTVSWGGVGCLWNRPVATVYVRPSRYTYEFLERGDYFTLSFYPAECKNALALLGRESGRDGDKVAASGLTPVPFGQSMTFTQAKTTLLCRKLYAQDMDPAHVPEDVRARFYPEGETYHRIYIGEIVDIKAAGEEA